MLKPVKSVACLIIPERQIIMWVLQKGSSFLYYSYTVKAVMGSFTRQQQLNGMIDNKLVWIVELTHSWSYCVCTYSISSVSMIHLERRVFLRVKIKPCAGHDFNYKGSIYPLDLAIQSLNCHKNHHFWTMTLCSGSCAYLNQKKTSCRVCLYIRLSSLNKLILSFQQLSCQLYVFWEACYALWVICSPEFSCFVDSSPHSSTGRFYTWAFRIMERHLGKHFHRGEQCEEEHWQQVKLHYEIWP